MQIQTLTKAVLTGVQRDIICTQPSADHTQPVQLWQVSLSHCLQRLSCMAMTFNIPL